jgi:CheY-like chemotaxis protein/LmbE family N-acetylglucosaminyl deacetylase
MTDTGEAAMDSGHDESPGRILLIEDDGMMAHFMTRVLGKDGRFEVVHAPDPVSALEQARSQSWDLVLTDVELPGMTCLELLAGLRRAAPGVPAAVVTAHRADDDAVAELRDQADGFLEKPVQPDHLRDAAAELVARGRAARAAGPQAVLAIGAHPGDAEIGAAGALLAHRALGHDISILTLTRGAPGGGDAGGESELAALALGATVYLGQLPDGGGAPDEPVAGLISQVLESVRPTVVYTHSRHDADDEHGQVHRAAMQAARGIDRVYCFQSPSATIGFQPSHCVPIDEQLERKLLAIRAFPSRLEVQGYLDDGLIESTASYWARFGAGQYAEAFEDMRDGAVSSG